MTLNEPVPSDPLLPVSNCPNASQDLDFMLVIQTRASRSGAGGGQPLGLTDRRGRSYNARLDGVNGRLWARPISEHKRPKAPSFDSPKFLSGGPSAMLQGPRKKLKVMKVEIIGKPVFLVR